MFQTHRKILLIMTLTMAAWPAVSRLETALAEPPADAGGAGQARPLALTIAEQAESLYGLGRYEEAAQLYRQLAGQGDSKAQTRLGTMTLQGQGVEKNLEQGVAWYVKAANQGDAEAQNKLGQLYELTRDYPQALVWFRKAALRGFADAQFNLGVMAEKGQGLAQDSRQAIAWYRKAAAAGHERAKKNLIRLGVSRNDPLRE